MARRLERHFLADDASFSDDEVVDISQHVASSLSAVDCASIVTQLLTYFDAYVRQIKVAVSYCVLDIIFYIHFYACCEFFDFVVSFY